MDEWRSFLPTITPNSREMQRRAKIHKASQQSGAEVSASQAIWNDGKNFRRIEIAAAQRRQDPVFLKARKKVNTFIDWLYDDAGGVVTKRLIDEHGDTRAVRSVLRAQRQFVVDLDMTPSAIGEWCDRGRDADLNAEEFQPLPRTATKEERVAREKLIKHRARQRTQANKQLINCGLIAEEIEARLAGGVAVVKSEVVNALVKAGTVSRSVAYNYFDDVLQVVLRTARYQDTSIGTLPEQSSQRIEGTPVIMVSGNETSESEPEESQVNVAPVRNPAQSTRQTTPPHWVVDKDTLTEWEDACWIREVWSEAVAKWRKAKQQQPAYDVDSVKDERFRAMVIDRSVWSHRRH
jgi:Zn-finger nucleic acid-binding protein